MKSTLLLIAMLLGAGTPLSVLADGNYWYSYGNTVRRFETLRDAINDAQSNPGLWQNLVLSDGATISPVDGTPRWTLSVPEHLPATSIGNLYYKTNLPAGYCGNQGWCSSQATLVDALSNFVEEEGWCLVSSPEIEGNVIFGGWMGTMATFPGPRLNRLFHGLTYRYEVRRNRQSDGTCPGRVETYHGQIGVLEPHTCPEYYLPRIAYDRQTATCDAKLEVPIHGPIPSACDETSGNPCGIVTGNKSETELDLSTDDLEFKRSYNSNQMN